ncbi:PKD domain-containing protein [Chloroflexota bacterium]
MSSLLLCWALLGCIPEPQNADFSAAPTEGEVPLEVQFTDQSLGEIDEWQWDFNNDGVVDSTLQNPRHIYNEPGVYTVSLTVRNSGGSDYEIKIGHLTCIPEPPDADFSAMPAEGEVPLEVQFTDQSLGEIDEWQWDFDNDGVVDSTLQSPRHIYSEPGTYTVNLTVSNSGASDEETKTGFVKILLPCAVDFMAEPTEVVGVKDIQFTDLSQGNITSWSWDFDSDGVVDSTERNPIHAYTRNGDYTVTLTINGPNCELSIAKDRYIHVGGCGG